MPNTPTLAELAADLESGRTSARKLVEDCIAKIADPSGEGQRTFIHVDKDAAIAAAAAMDHLRKANAAPSRFAASEIVSRRCQKFFAWARLCATAASVT